MRGWVEVVVLRVLRRAVLGLRALLPRDELVVRRAVEVLREVVLGLAVIPPPPLLLVAMSLYSDLTVAT